MSDLNKGKPMKGGSNCVLDFLRKLGKKSHFHKSKNPKIPRKRKHKRTGGNDE